MLANGFSDDTAAISHATSNIIVVFAKSLLVVDNEGMEQKYEKPPVLDFSDDESKDKEAKGAEEILERLRKLAQEAA